MLPGVRTYLKLTARLGREVVALGVALLLENLSVFNARTLAAFLHGEPTRSPTPSPVRIQVWQIQPAVSIAARLRFLSS
jgi:hypothetical protein